MPSNMVSLFKHFGRRRFQNGRSKAPKRYAQALDKYRQTKFRQQSSRPFTSHFKFGNDNLENKII